MKVSICAVGRLRRGPELELLSDYLDRFNKQGRSMGLGPADVIEVEDKKNIGMPQYIEISDYSIKILKSFQNFYNKKIRFR